MLGGALFLNALKGLVAVTIALSQSATVSNQSKTAGTTLTLNDNSEGVAGKAVVIAVALDNTLTTDGDNSLVTSITDGNSNLYEKVAEFTNGQGAAAGGATCSLWCCRKLATTLSTLITINHGSVTARAANARFYSLGAGNQLTWVASPATLANDGADPGSLSLSSLTSLEYLFYRATAYEAALVTTPTASTNFSLSPGTAGGDGTASGGAASNMSVFSEYRIVTATSQTSDPTVTSADCASIFAAFFEQSTAAASFPPIRHQAAMQPLLVR